MISVSAATKLAWMDEKSTKEYEISVEWHGLTDVYGNSDIKKDSINISASIMQSDAIKFGGCIARKLEVVFAGPWDLSGNYSEFPISLRARANGTDWIPLFTGTTVSVEVEENGVLAKYTAYDDFYRLSNVDSKFNTWSSVSGSYLPMFGVLEDFCQYFDITIDQSAVFENGAKVIKTAKQVENVNGTDFLKNLCELNGCFGMLDGEGKFKTIYLDPEASGTTITQYSGFLKKSGCFGMDQICMRPTAESESVMCPDGTTGDHVYVIQENPFIITETTGYLIDITDNKLYQIADKILDGNYCAWDDTTIIPFEAEQKAMPWLECGDKVKYYDAKTDTYIESYILSWTFKGDQACKNTFAAEIKEDLGPFVPQPSDKQRDVMYSLVDISNGDELATGSIYLVYEN